MPRPPRTWQTRPPWLPPHGRRHAGPPSRAALPPPRRVRRRTFLRLAGAGVGLALSAETLRVFALTNRHTVVPGRVYRTAQLSGPQLADFIAEKGIRTVVNLRGLGPDTDWYVAECRATHAANVCQEDVTLSAKRLPPPAELRRLLDVLDRTEYPIVFHCQRGADRTGLTATVVMLLQPGVGVAEARKQLSVRFGHVRAGRTAVIDEFFDYYESWLASTGQAHTPDRFREWVSREYVPGPYWAELTIPDPAGLTVKAGRGFAVVVRAVNRGVGPWEFKPGPAGAVHLRGEVYTKAGEKVHRATAGHLRATVPPGGRIDLTAAFPPIYTPGVYPSHFDLVDAQAIDLLDSCFVQYGSEPLMVNVTVE